MSDTIKYRVGGWREPIESLHVVKETPKTIECQSPYGSGRTDRLFKSAHHIFDTWEDAWAFLIECDTKRIRNLTEQRKDAETTLAAHRLLTPPQD